MTRHIHHLPRFAARAVSSALVAAQLVTPISLVAQQPSAPPADPGQRKTVIVNRTVPSTAAPRVAPRFSAEPASGEITAARIFEEPLVPVGGAPNPPENRALVAAIREYLESNRSEAVAPFLLYINRFPQSPWVPSLLSNLGGVYKANGYFSKAIEAWRDAWRLARDVDGVAARATADRAVSELMVLVANFGDTELLDILIEQLGGRQFEGSAAERVSIAREAARMFKDDHQLAEPSGAEALQQLLWQGAPGTPANRVLDSVHAAPAGMSMPELLQLSRQVGMNLQIARWERTAEVPLPSIVHLRVGHFAAVVAEREGKLLLRDRILGGDVWITRGALQEETSGYFLVAAGTLPPGWVTATEAETAGVVGHCGNGYPHHSDPGGPPCGGPPPPPDRGGGGPPPSPDRSGGGPPPSPDRGGGGPPPPPDGGCSVTGMPAYDFHTLRVSLQVWDVPVGYTPPVGPAVNMLLQYTDRDINQPVTFTYGNVGPKWAFGFLAYLKDDPGSPSGQVQFYTPVGGGRQDYSVYDSATQTFAAHWRSNATLVRTSSNPIRYERRLPDGSMDIFTLADTISPASRRIFMTEHRDREGHTLQYTYDGSFRLVALTDAIGQVTILSYQHPTDPLKLTKVTDPFGRFATFTYDAKGHLSAITDVIGLTSSFRYIDGSFISALTTPYGRTTFRQGSTATAFRFLEATDPLGGTERLEFRRVIPELAATLPSSEVPTGFADQNWDMQSSHSVYWDKLAHARFPGDITKAVVTKWLRDTTTTAVVAVKHSEKRPLESRVWYAYPGQWSPSVAGTLVTSSRVGRRLDDGSSQIWELDYNAQGYPTARRDPLGREQTYVYAANGIDLLEVRQTTGAANDLLQSFGSYNSQHLPGSIIDAAGQTTTLTYNTRGQVLTVTNPKSETTTRVYDADGYLTGVTGPVSGSTATFTYDSYRRVQTVTNSDGDTVTANYDALDRLTTVTYPNSTTEQRTYDRLDLSTYRDRAGRLTRVFYDPLRRMALVRDPLGRSVRQQWCSCGTLDALIDGKGQATSWEYDVQARPTREIRANSQETAFGYETTNSRLTSVTDAKGQIATYAYALDNALLSVAYTNEDHPTPNVTWTYDATYGRTASMVDGVGTWSYTYYGVGVLGATLITSIDGPRTNDTLTYTYDELGRGASRALNGVTVAWDYDSLGRLESEVNPLGMFDYAYDGVTSRTASVTYPNGQTSLYTYLGNAYDRRLGTLHHKTPSSATLSKFDYAYDMVGNILTWQQQADGDDPVKWTFGYDTADQLIDAVKRATDVPQTVLERYGYRYDTAGNRTAEQIGDVVTGATHDSTNQLLTHTPAGALRVAGVLDEPGAVTIDGDAAPVDASNRFLGTRQLTTGSNTFTVVAKDAAGNTQSQTYEVDASGASRTFSYDDNGNMTSDGTLTFEWDAENRLAAVVNTTKRSEFTYDGLSRRIRIVEKESGTTTRDASLFWADTTIIEERLTTGEINRFYRHGEQHNGSARYLTRDHLGSVREMTDASGMVVTRNDFDPYGRLTRLSGTQDTRFGFTGQYAHTPTGLGLTLYRAYDANIGRWLSEDPAKTIDGPNLFTYVLQNPLSLVDPLGLRCDAPDQGAPGGPPTVNETLRRLDEWVKSGRVTEFKDWLFRTVLTEVNNIFADGLKGGTKAGSKVVGGSAIAVGTGIDLLKLGPEFWKTANAINERNKVYEDACKGICGAAPQNPQK